MSAAPPLSAAAARRTRAQLVPFRAMCGRDL